MFTELPTLKEILVEMQPWEYLKLSGRLFLKGEEVAILPEKERYIGGGRFAFYAEAARGGFYANDSLPVTADTAEITIEDIEGRTGIAKDIIFVSTTGEEVRLSFPGISTIETLSVVLYELPESKAGMGWLPMPPDMGPPLPRYLGIFWPWHAPPGAIQV